MKTTHEIACEMLVKLSDSLMKARTFARVNESDSRVAYLHGMAFFENSTNLIAAINFVDVLYEQIDEQRSGIADELYDQLTALLGDVDTARRWLLTFTDELRAEFDEERRQSPLAERIEELENAIRSFTSEEGDDVAESLFDSLEVVERNTWEDGMNTHRKAIEKLRALVPPHRIG